LTPPCRGESGTSRMEDEKWYGDVTGVRLSGFLGLGTELFVLTFCSVIDRLDVYLWINVAGMNLVWLVCIAYRRVILRRGIRSSGRVLNLHFQSRLDGLFLVRGYRKKLAKVFDGAEIVGRHRPRFQRYAQRLRIRLHPGVALDLFVLALRMPSESRTTSSIERSSVAGSPLAQA